MSSTKTCSNLSPFPFGMTSGTGSLVNNIPMICGGNNGQVSSKTCYYHDRASNAWILIGNMEKARSHAGSAPLNGALWVSGGYGSPYSTTEIVHLNGTIIAGPPLPGKEVQILYPVCAPL